MHLDLELGLHGHLLPCVPFAEGLEIAPGSTLNKIGKVPSAFNAAGLVHGIKGWQTKDITDDEVAIWSSDPRLNICVRTGPISGLYAIDVDVPDPVKAEEIAALIESTLGYKLPRRYRGNSGKFLLLFWMTE
jgi:Bifunctional DNA primase/polymerase, N-terminal